MATVYRKQGVLPILGQSAGFSISESGDKLCVILSFHSNPIDSKPYCISPR